MAIQWFSPNTMIPIVTVAEYGLTFNSGCLPYFQTARSLQLGGDAREKKMYVRLLTDRKTPGFLIPDRTAGTKNIRISCREFVQFLKFKCQIDIVKSPRFYLDADTDGRLVADLTAPLASPASRAGKGSK